MTRLQANALGLLLMFTTALPISAQLKANNLAGKVSVDTSAVPAAVAAPVAPPATVNLATPSSPPKVESPTSSTSPKLPSQQKGQTLLGGMKAVTPALPQPDAPAQPIAPVSPTPDNPFPNAPKPSSPNVESPPASSSAVAPDTVAPITEYVLPARERQPLGRSGTVVDEEGAGVQTGGSKGWVLNTLGALGVVIGLIFLMRYGIQRITGTTGTLSNNSELIEVMARVTIAPRTQALFLRINQRVVVASLSANGVQPLTELTDPEDVAWVLGRVQSQQAMSITEGFNQVLRRFDKEHEDAEPLGSIEDAENDEQYVDRTRHEMSGLLGRIRNMKNRSV